MKNNKLLFVLFLIPLITSCSSGSLDVDGTLKKIENIEKKISKLDDLRNFDKKNKLKQEKALLQAKIYGRTRPFIH